MDETKRQGIEELTARVTAARQRVRMLDHANVAGLSLEERVKLDTEYSIAKAEYMEASFALESLFTAMPIPSLGSPDRGEPPQAKN